MQLHEQYRPRSWGEVVGQDKVLARLDLLRKRAGFLTDPRGSGSNLAGAEGPLPLMGRPAALLRTRAALRGPCALWPDVRLPKWVPGKPGAGRRREGPCRRNLRRMVGIMSIVPHERSPKSPGAFRE